ncbi:MAG TPA: type II secretion system F family protein [Acidimicrobiia bacterium]|nr:type II secretion system F family protein [Acidimicrobiia bacterium]
MTPVLIALVLATSIAALTFVVGSVTAERADVRESLRRLEGYQIQDVRDQEMLAPITERVFAPLLEGLTGVARRFTPAGFGEGVAAKLVLAGSPPNLNVDKILVMKLLGIVSVIVWAPVVLALGMSGVVAFAAILLLWGASFLYPDVLVNRKIEDRQKEISRKLPDILDLLVISVEAGLGFEQALDRTCTAVPGALSDEFRRMLHEIRIGSSRADALRAMADRTDVAELRAFILAMLQADTFGVSISRLLRAQADDMRVRRRLRAQEQAQKAPVKMLFPLVFCIFPSIFVVILGPAFIEISRSL